MDTHATWKWYETDVKVPIKTYPSSPHITEIDDRDLILELIGRGYAVAKMSAEDLAEANK